MKKPFVPAWRDLKLHWILVSGFCAVCPARQVPECEGAASECLHRRDNSPSEAALHNHFSYCENFLRGAASSRDEISAIGDLQEVLFFGLVGAWTCPGKNFFRWQWRRFAPMPSRSRRSHSRLREAPMRDHAQPGVASKIFRLRIPSHLQAPRSSTSFTHRDRRRDALCGKIR